MASFQNNTRCSLEGVHCQKNASHYCNTCGDAMCGKCKNRHTKRQKDHQIVLFQDRENQNMVSEKCRIHPDLVYFMVCENCLVPVCTQCITDDHRGHVFEELYEDFITKLDQCKQVVNRLKSEILPQSHALLSGVKTDLSSCKSTFDDIRSSMTLAAIQLKDAIDKILEEKMAGLDKMEKSAKTTLEDQEEVIGTHIKNLEKIVSKYEQIEQLDKPSEFILFHKENHVNDIPAIPELYQMSFPSFVKREAHNLSLKSQFGIITELKLKPKLRTTKDIKIENKKQGEVNVKCIKNDKDEKCIKLEQDVKRTFEVNQPSILETVSKIEIQGIGRTRHVSCYGNNMWISDDQGNLVLSDIKGNILDRVNEDIYLGDGFHTVTKSGDLLIIDELKNIVYRKSTRKKKKAVIYTGEWSPTAVFCSLLNGNILVAHKNSGLSLLPNGEPKAGNGMVAIYNCSYEKLREIILDEFGRELYSLPYYISQNINGNICVSDFDKKAVVVVDELGSFQFSYAGHPIDPAFHPSGICCDSNGNLLIFNSSCRTVHLLDINGFLVSRILHLSINGNPGIISTGPHGICCDGKGNLWVGEYFSPVVRIYKYNNSKSLLEQYFLKMIMEF